jgi:hypothetical protein
VQLFKYTRGDGHARLFLFRQLIRYSVYAISVLLCIAAGYLHTSIPLFIVVAGLSMYFFKFWRRWWIYTEQFMWWKKICGLPAVAGLVVYGDIAKMLGWPVGVYERITKKVIFESY